MSNRVTVKRLPTGYYHVRGAGPCNYCQPSAWPATEAEIRVSAHPEASEDFLRAVISAADDERNDDDEQS